MSIISDVTIWCKKNMTLSAYHSLCSDDLYASCQLHARPIESDDAPFLKELYASTRSQEMALTGWSDEEKKVFLYQQFELKTHHTFLHYPDAQFLILEREQAPIGRLSWLPGASEAKLIEISLLPHIRQQGLGSALLGFLTAHADRYQLRISLQVQIDNLASRLYQRFHFIPLGIEGLYLKMQRLPVSF